MISNIPVGRVAGIPNFPRGQSVEVESLVIESAPENKNKKDITSII
jgi:hypothetical protein